MVILKVKEYAEQEYKYAVQLDLSKYFDTINYALLINLLRKTIKDERVIHLIKKYLKSGVLENGVCIKTEEGSPHGGPLSPLLSNIYLNEFDHEFANRGVKVIRYADDIVLLAKSKRATERLLETSTRYLEEGETETQRTDFPQSGQKCQSSHEEHQSLHDRMAEPLRKSNHERNDEGLERMAAETNPNVYLETVE